MTEATPSNRLIILAFWLLIMSASGWVVLTQLRLITNVAQFMPQAQTPAEKLLLEELHQGAAARVILLGIEGGDLKTVTTASKRLAANLRGGEIFARVENGEHSLRELQATPLFQQRYLLSPAVDAEHFTVPALRAGFEQRLLDLTTPFALFNKQLLPQDPTNAVGPLLQLLLAQDKTQSEFGVWVSPDRSRALLLAETRAQGYDVQAQIEALRVIESAFAKIKAADSGLRLLLSGPAVFATHAQDRIQQEVTLLSALASIAVMLILWLAYRGLPLLLLCALPVLSAMLIASAALTVMFGPVHGITLAFGVTVIGVAIDYPIHLFSHLSGQRQVREELQAIWPTLRLGVLTTVAGYGAMLATDFSGLAQFGWFAVIGLLSAAAVTRWVLPSLLPGNYAPAGDRLMGGRILARWQPRRLARAIPLLLGVAAVVIISFKNDALWQNDLAALSPIPQDRLTLDRQMRADLGAADAAHLILVSAPDAQTALRRSEDLHPWLEQLRQQGAIDGFDAASRYLPSAQRQTERQQWFPDNALLRHDVMQALQDLPFKAAQFQPFLDAVAQAKQAPPVTPESLQGSALGVKVQSLLLQRDSGWTALILLHGVHNSSMITAGLPQHDYVHYLNFKEATNGLVREFRDETLARMQWAAIIIVLVVSIGLRSLRGLFAALLPVVLAIAVTVALELVLGLKISLFNLVALLLVLGIGIDYGLFFSRQEHDPGMRGRTFHALMLCALSTVAVFGILSLSDVPVLRDIGITVWIGVFFSFIFAVILSRPATREPIHHYSSMNR